MIKSSWTIVAIAICISAIALVVIAASLVQRNSWTINWLAIESLGTWVAAVGASIIGYLVWRTNKRIEWLTGSMEAYQMKELQLAALEHPSVKLLWWDPEIEPWPHCGRHGEEVKTTTLYLGVPLAHRRGHSR